MNHCLDVVIDFFDSQCNHCQEDHSYDVDRLDAFAFLVVLP